MIKILFLTIIIIFNALPAMAVNYCSDSNTAGAWLLDETSGSYVDCTPNLNTGVISGTIDQTATLKYGNAASFTTVNNSTINFGSNAVIDNVFDAGGTFAAWIGLSSAGTASNRCTGSELFSKDGANDGFGLCVNTTGAIVFSYKWAGGWVDWTSNTNPFSAFSGAAQHVLVYYNSDSISNVPTVLIGCSALTMVQGGTAPATPRNTDAALSLRIGLDGVDTGEVNGKFDEVIYYNGDLTGSCSALSTEGIDGTHGAVSSGTSLLMNGVNFDGASTLN